MPLPTHMKSTQQAVNKHWPNQYIGNSTIIGSENGLWPGQHQAIIWTNGGILLILPIETNFSEFLITILTASFKQMVVY